MATSKQASNPALRRFVRQLACLAVGVGALFGCVEQNRTTGRSEDEAAAARPRACSVELEDNEFHYIVVGSGAGGGPVASRLARAGCEVLLLEAGEDVGGTALYDVPAMHALSTEASPMAWWFFVKHHVDAALDREDSKATDQGILYPRGSALGGSTAVNALVTVLPSTADWNRLAAVVGRSAYRATAMDGYYDRVREWLSVEVPDPGLATSDPKVVDYLLAAANVFAGESPLGSSASPNDWVGTASQLGRLLEQDVNASLRTGETEGLFRLPLATKNGRRNGTREFILDTIEAGDPLTLRTNAFVTKVLWDREDGPPRAIGVEYVRGSNVYDASLDTQAPTSTQQSFVSGEVILSAGAFNSPQLLMLSGVGDASHLREHGIEVVADRPGVGRNLQDRYEVAVVSEFDAPLEILEDCDLLGSWTEDACAQQWKDGYGVYQTSGFLASVLRRSSPAEPLADLQVFATPSDARGYYPGYAADALRDKRRFSWLVLKGHTHNRDGTVRLRSADPFERPEIHFSYFDEFDPISDPDLWAVVAGVKFVRAIEARMQSQLTSEHLEEIWPGPDVVTDDEIAAWIRREAWGHHASCSNKMGKADDALAVVDWRFRVIGADGLRVVDASVFPEIPGTFIALPTFMLSERAAEFILEDAG